MNLHERCMLHISEWKKVSFSVPYVHMLFLQKEKENKKTHRVLKVSTPNVKNIYTWSARLWGIQVGKFSHLTLKTGILCIACSIFAKNK